MKDRTLAIKKVQAYAENPEIIKEPSMGEMADLVVLVLNAIEEIDGLIKAGRLDGKTPESDKDYMSYETAQSVLRKEIQNFLNRGESVLSETATELEKRVQQAIKNIRNGENGIVTDADIVRASQMALEMIDLPDFDSLVDEKMTANPIAVRDGLESIIVEEDKLKIEAISNLRKELDSLKSLSNNTTGGGVRLLRYLADVNLDGITNGETIVWNSTTVKFEPGSAGGSVSDTAYAGSWNGVTDVAPSKNAVYDKIEALVLGSGTGDVVGPGSAVNNNFASFDLTTGKLIKDSGVSSASFATALGADDNYVTDAEKAALHAAVTVADSAEIDFTLVGQQISASIIAGSIDETKLDVSTNASLDLADASLQDADIGVNVQAYDADLAAVAALATTGIAVRTGAGTWAVRDMAYPAAGLTITNSAGVAGNPTFALTNDLAALEALATTGFAQRTGADTWSLVTDLTSSVAAASTTQSGVAEASIASEVNTGTDAARYVSPDSLAGSNFGIRYVTATLNGTTALTTSEKVYFRIPAALTGMNLVSVSATVGTGAAGSSSSGTPTFTVKNVTDSNQMLSTSLTVDASEYTSATAATPAVINASFDDVVTDDLIEVAVTTSGTGVTYATVTCGFQLP